MHTKIMMVAGEASGDLHGANLAQQLKTLLPQAEIFGMGGARMAEQGVHLLVQCAPSSVVGAVEVLGSIGAIARSFRRLRRSLKSERPDLLVLIDFPGFNLLLGRLWYCNSRKHGFFLCNFIFLGLIALNLLWLNMMDKISPGDFDALDFPLL